MDRTSAPDGKTLILSITAASFKSIRQLIIEQKPLAEDWADRAAGVSVVLMPQSGTLQYKIGSESWVDALNLVAETDKACEIAVECILSKLTVKSLSGTIALHIIVFTK